MVNPKWLSLVNSFVAARWILQRVVAVEINTYRPGCASSPETPSRFGLTPILPRWDFPYSPPWSDSLLSTAACSLTRQNGNFARSAMFCGTTESHNPRCPVSRRDGHHFHSFFFCLVFPRFLTVRLLNLKKLAFPWCCCYRNLRKNT